MTESDNTNHSGNIRFSIKGSATSLRAKGNRGVKLAVEAKNIITGDVHQFESIVATTRYLAEVLNTDDPAKIVNIKTSIGLHVRKPQPTPYHNHLFRVKPNKSLPWPDYSHVELERISNTNQKVKYPVWLKNIKTQDVVECKTKTDVINLIGRVAIHRSIERKSTNKGYRIYNSRQEAMDDGGEVYSKAHKYVYRVTDARTGSITQFDTVETLSVRLKEDRLSIMSRFSASGSNVVYYGKDNRYKIERSLTSTKVTRELIKILKTLQSIKEQSQTDCPSDLLNQIIKAAQALKTKGMS